MDEYLVTYDLKKPITEYPNLIEKLEKLNAFNIHSSVWVLYGNYDTNSLFLELKKFCNTGDKLLVTAVSQLHQVGNSKLYLTWCISRIENRLMELSQS